MIKWLLIILILWILPLLFKSSRQYLKHVCQEVEEEKNSSAWRKWAREIVQKHPESRDELNKVSDTLHKAGLHKIEGEISKGVNYD